ncbi:MAG: hypothetical protein ACRDCE_16925 [Cetobacterium sp.]|uniref:hypothetical protein n=1 Tax=Cetobacterium sp. TaxID=2071632 RepID=UPI003EE5FB51
MGLFKNLIDKLIGNKEININFRLDLKKMDIDKNFLYPFCEKKINILENEKIERIAGKNILFNRLNFKCNSVFEVLEISDENIRLNYPKNIKIANFLHNYLILVWEPYSKSLKFDIEEDYRCYSNILTLISKYELNDEINISEFLNEIPWIESLKIFGNDNLEINIKGQYALTYDYEILEKSIKKIIGKYKDEYILVDLVNCEIKIGREL